MYLNRRKNLILIIAVVFFACFVSFLIYERYFSPISAKILRAKSLNDLKPYPELNVFPALLQAFRCDPESDENFEALFHYWAMCDGGAATYMDRDSFFFFFRENPFILQKRYVQTGDERILLFCRKILEEYDPWAFSGEGDSYEDKKKTIDDLIKKLQYCKKTPRENKYFKNIEETRF